MLPACFKTHYMSEARSIQSILNESFNSGLKEPGRKARLISKPANDSFVVLVHYKETDDRLLRYVKKSNLGFEKKNTLKSTHINTAKAIIRAYAKHLKALSLAHLRPLEPHFRTNNVALAEMTSLNPSSVWRHVERLITHGIIKEKIFRGTNASYELIINPDILAADNGVEFEAFKDSQYQKLMKKQQLDEADYAFLKTIKADFSQGFYFSLLPFMIAECKHIEDRKHLQETNINMEQETVERYSAALHNSENAIDESTHFQEQETINRKQRRQADGCAKKTTDFWVGMVWNFLIMALYSGRRQPDETLEYRAKGFILHHLTKETENVPEISEKWISVRANAMMECAMLARRYKERSPDRFIPNIDTWLDPEFQHGFIGTIPWLTKTRKRRKENREYLASVKELVKWYNYYVKYPGLHSFMQARQALGKKHDKGLIEIFDQAVEKCNLTNDDVYLHKAV